VDAVGTLLRLREPPAAVYVRIAAKHGISVAQASVARALDAVRIGPPALEGVALADVPERERDGWREIVRAALGDVAADGPCFEAIFSCYANAEPWQLVPGVRSALASARSRGTRLAVVSNMDARLPGVLAGLGLADAFDAVVVPSTCGFAKPDPRIFRAALSRLGVGGDSAVYIGDREPECVAAARAAGLRAWRLDPAGAPGDPDVLSGWDGLAPRLAAFAHTTRSG
jgi:putative hydrolase of the HAD superfamily